MEKKEGFHHRPQYGVPLRQPCSLLEHRGRNRLQSPQTDSICAHCSDGTLSRRDPQAAQHFLKRQGGSWLILLAQIIFPEGMEPERLPGHSAEIYC